MTAMLFKFSDGPVVGSSHVFWTRTLKWTLWIFLLHLSPTVTAVTVPVTAQDLTMPYEGSRAQALKLYLRYLFLLFHCTNFFLHIDRLCCSIVTTSLQGSGEPRWRSASQRVAMKKSGPNDHLAVVWALGTYIFYLVHILLLLTTNYNHYIWR